MAERNKESNSNTRRRNSHILPRHITDQRAEGCPLPSNEHKTSYQIRATVRFITGLWTGFSFAFGLSLCCLSDLTFDRRVGDIFGNNLDFERHYFGAFVFYDFSNRSVSSALFDTLPPCLFSFPSGDAKEVYILWENSILLTEMSSVA